VGCQIWTGENIIFSQLIQIEIFASLSVIGESTIQCLAGEKKQNVRHDRAELHELIDFGAGLDLKFLYPGELVIDACSRLAEKIEAQYSALFCTFAPQFLQCDPF
jgi:hypothetical protein